VRVSKHGRRIDISLTISPVCDGAGRIVGASKVARDITDRKRAEERCETRTGARMSSSRCSPTNCATRWPPLRAGQACVPTALHSHPPASTHEDRRTPHFLYLA